jgi:hypothetical protein
MLQVIRSTYYSNLYDMQISVVSTETDITSSNMHSRIRRYSINMHYCILRNCSRIRSYCCFHCSLLGNCFVCRAVHSQGDHPRACSCHFFCLLRSSARAKACRAGKSFVIIIHGFHFNLWRCEMKSISIQLIL